MAIRNSSQQPRINFTFCSALYTLLSLSCSGSFSFVSLFNVVEIYTPSNKKALQLPAKRRPGERKMKIFNLLINFSQWNNSILKKGNSTFQFSLVYSRAQFSHFKGSNTLYQMIEGEGRIKVSFILHAVFLSNIIIISFIWRWKRDIPFECSQSTTELPSLLLLSLADIEKRYNFSFFWEEGGEHKRSNTKSNTKYLLDLYPTIPFYSS